jgi:Pectate lyase superfamily protein
MSTRRRFLENAGVALGTTLFHGSLFRETEQGKGKGKGTPIPPPPSIAANYWDEEYGSMLNVKLPPYNAVGDGTTDDRVAIQAALDDAPSAGYRVFFPAGVYGVGNELFVPHSVHVVGEGDSSQIKALSTFSFPTNEYAILHQKVSGGSPVTFAPGSGLGRIYIRDIKIDGNNRPNATGVLACLQQPAHWENVRADNCPAYGFVLTQGQQAVLRNCENIACGTGLYIRGSSFVWVYDYNCEQHTVQAVLIDDCENILRPYGLSFTNTHTETSTPGSSGREFNIQEVSDIQFDNCFFTCNGTLNLFHFQDMSAVLESGGPIYSIRNARASGDLTNVNFLVDASRGITKNAYTAFRAHIPFLVAGNEDPVSAPWPGPPSAVRIVELSNVMRTL